MKISIGDDYSVLLLMSVRGQSVDILEIFTIPIWRRNVNCHMRLTLTIGFISALLILNLSAIGQGCSDAGFCTIGNLGHSRANHSLQQQKLSFLLPLGVGDENVLVFSPGIQYDNKLSENWSVQGKLTANYADGNLGSAFGLGDLFLSGTHTFIGKKNWNTSITLGTKILLNLGNLKVDDKALPMQYQSSLGTVDLITGFSLGNESWQFSLGWQQPLSGINRNNFLPAYWDTPEAEKYPPSNDFNRRGDVLLRAGHIFTMKQKFSLTPGLLGIYHLSEDTYIDGNISNGPIPIIGSQGLTLNVTLAGSWNVSEKLTIGFSAGAPVVARDVRPDGLTRSIVISPEISWNF